MTDESNQDNSDEPTLIEWFKSKYPEAWEKAVKELKGETEAAWGRIARRRRNRDETE
jgi:hypothetical protein